MSYISQDGGEYSIWEGWVNGKGYEMAFVPSIDQYRYRRYKYANRGHMVTKSKYLVLRSLIAIAKGDLDPVTFTNRTKLTNFELFQLGFPDEGIPGGIVD